MNKQLKDELAQITEIGKKIMKVEADLNKNRDRLSTLSGFSGSISNLPDVRVKLEQACAALEKEISEEEAELETLKAELKK